MAAVGCALLAPRFESVTPEYGYVDGCTPITLGGADIGTEATVTIAGQPLLAIAAAAYDTAFPEWAQDVGFEYTGLTPPAPSGQPGYVDVVMTIPADKEGGDAIVRTLPKGFYYLACPAEVHVDALGLPTADETGDTFGPVAQPTAAGATIDVSGCGLDAASVVAELRNPADGAVVATMPLEATCGTAEVQFTIPAETVPGTYFFTLSKDGVVAYGESCFSDTGVDSGGDSAVADSDAADTAVSVGGCAFDVLVTVEGGAP
jgi:hypothetical protein